MVCISCKFKYDYMHRQLSSWNCYCIYSYIFLLILKPHYIMSSLRKHYSYIYPHITTRKSIYKKNINECDELSHQNFPYSNFYSLSLCGYSHISDHDIYLWFIINSSYFSKLSPYHNLHHTVNYINLITLLVY